MIHGLCHLKILLFNAQLYTKEKEREFCKNRRLQDFATGHLYFGLHKEKNFWVFREWAPNAIEVYLVGDFSNWEIIQNLL